MLSSRWTVEHPLIFGLPDGRAVLVTARASIRGLTPGDTFVASGAGLEAAAEEGFFALPAPDPPSVQRKGKNQPRKEIP